MDNEPLVFDFKDVNEKDKARIISAVEQTTVLTKSYMDQKSFFSRI